MKRFLAILCTFILCFGFVGCGGIKNENAYQIVNIEEGKQAFKAYSPEQTKEDGGLKFEYSENLYDEYYVYYFYLGVIKNVPVYSSAAMQYSYDTEVTLLFESLTEEGLTESVSKSVSSVDSLSYTKGVEKSVETELSSEISAEYGGAKASVKASIKAGLSESHSWTSSWEKTLTESTARESSYVKSYGQGYEEKVAFSEKSGFVKGNYYRMTFYETVKAYGVLLYDLNSKKYYPLTEFHLQENTTVRVWEESKDSVFNYAQDNELAFDVASAVAYAQENQTPISDKFMVEQKYGLVKNTEPFKVTQDGYFGLQKEPRDEIILTEYEEYFNEDYLFCFKVCINISEVDEGYKEVYLYSDNTTTSKEVELPEAQETYGMICGNVITHSGGSKAANHYLNWYVRGNQIQKTMYVRYDAHGEGDDTWWRRALTVDLKILSTEKDVEQAEVLNNDSKSSVGHVGFYGLAQGKTFDKINLEAFKNYMTEGYLFLFDVSIDISEKDNGYQEIYLYNQDSTTSSDVTLAQARKRGLVTGKMIEHVRGKKSDETKTYNFTMTALGSSLIGGDEADKWNVYLKYDAWGDDTDTWIKEKIKVTLTIVKIPQFIADDSVTEAYKKFNG